MHPEAARQPTRIALRNLRGLALVILFAQLISACANSPRTQDPYDELAEPGPAPDVVPEERPSEDGFLSLVQHYCGRQAVGDATIAERLRTDPAFRELTLGLYHGELTNGQYTRRLLARHPAADANVDATGCVVNQLQKCYRERCSVPIAERPLPERTPPRDLEVYEVRGPI
jgi:hypothetical protein